MASAANDSHAAGSAATGSTRPGSDLLSNTNWQFIECAKCREDAVVADKNDPSLFTLRPDFQLTACGHISCSNCLQASVQQDGSHTCPKCKTPTIDWIPLQVCQNQPSVGVFFRSIEAMLGEINSTMQFQTDNLRDQARYYKDIAKKQSAVLKQTKQELMELRAMKKNFDALQRENTALKQQLGSSVGPIHSGHPPLSPTRGQQAAATPSSYAGAGIAQPGFIEGQPGGYRVQQNMQISEAVPHAQGLSRPMSRAQEPISRPLRTPFAGPQMGQPPAVLQNQRSSVKRTAAEAGFGQLSMPARVSEADLPAFGMSSARANEHRERPQAGEVHADTSEFLDRFRFQGGGSRVLTPDARASSRLSNHSAGRSREDRILRSGGSAGVDLPAIQEGAIYARHAEAEGHGDRSYQSFEQPVGIDSGFAETSDLDSPYAGPQEPPRDAGPFGQASHLSRQAQHAAPMETTNERPRSFRPLLSSRQDHNLSSAQMSRQPQLPTYRAGPSDNNNNNGRPVPYPTAQRAFQPNLARPASAHPGAHHYHQPSANQQSYGNAAKRPATAQAGQRRSEGLTGASGIAAMPMPMAAPRYNKKNVQNGSRFQYQN